MVPPLTLGRIRSWSSVAMSMRAFFVVRPKSSAVASEIFPRNSNHTLFAPLRSFVSEQNGLEPIEEVTILEPGAVTLV